MALLPENLDYTEKDFDSIRARLIVLIRSVFPDWTDFNVSNFGNILMELNAHIADVLLFYQDNQANESRLPTAQLRRSILGLVKLLNYVPSSATAATTDLTVVLGSVPVGDVLFSAGDRFSTIDINNPVSFQVLTDVTVLAGTDPPVALLSVENSRTRTEQFSSTSLPNQSYVLANTGFVDGSSGVSAVDGTYSKVDDFLDSLSTDRHYTIEVDENDRAHVTFGDGVNGTIPSGVITVTYKTGGGPNGNVEQDAIQKPLQTYTDNLANPVTISSLSHDQASGGASRQSNESIKQQAPASLRVLNRTVAREDFEIVAEEVAGVARALMLTSNERASIAENQGELHIIPEGGGTPSSVLKAAVLERVRTTKPHTLTFFVDAFDPTYLTINVQATVFLSAGVAAATADAAVRANLAAFFALNSADGSKNENVLFGAQYTDADGNVTSELSFSDVYNVVRDSSGIRKMGDTPGAFLLNGELSDVAIESFEFPILGTVTLINGATGTALV